MVIFNQNKVAYNAETIAKLAKIGINALPAMDYYILMNWASVYVIEIIRYWMIKEIVNNVKNTVRIVENCANFVLMRIVYV